MSALEAVAPPPPRPLRFARADPLRPAPIVGWPDHWYHWGSKEVPYPPEATPYLYTGGCVTAAATWARVLGGLMNELRTAPFCSPRGEKLTMLARALTEPGGPVSADVLAMVLHLSPPRPCLRCGRPTLKGSGHQSHCSDTCRRRYAEERGRRA